MTFDLEKSTNIVIKPSPQELELYIEDCGDNRVLIMQQLIDEIGLDLIFDSLCETRLKDLKRELDKRISEEG